MRGISDEEVGDKTGSPNRVNASCVASGSPLSATASASYRCTGRRVSASSWSSTSSARGEPSWCATGNGIRLGRGAAGSPKAGAPPRRGRGAPPCLGHGHSRGPVVVGTGQVSVSEGGA